MRASGIFLSLTTPLICSRNPFFTLLNVSPDMPGVDLVVALRLTKPILFSSDIAQDLVCDLHVALGGFCHEL